MENVVSIPFNQDTIDIVHQMRTMTQHMGCLDEEVISEEQEKIRLFLQSKNIKSMPNCFAMGIAMIEKLENKTKWSDFKPQQHQAGEITQRIFNIAERQHDVRRTEMLKCICGHPISADNSYFYCNPTVAPTHLVVGADCAKKWALITHEELAKLRKQKQELRKKRKQEEKKKEKLLREKEQLQKWQEPEKSIQKYKEYTSKIKFLKVMFDLRPDVWCPICGNSSRPTNPYHFCRTCFVIFQNSN